MKESVSVFLKGAAMGAANVIPGVSGGTVAFVAGIYERLILAIRGLDAPAAGLLLRGRLSEFAQRVDFGFLATLGAGVVVSILTLAHLLEYLFAHHAVGVWAFFFGLILASVFFVGRRVGRWKAGPVIWLVVGAGAAVAVALLEPGRENDGFFYLVLCGVVAMASMIIPGLSGSFVLLLLGNYHLVMVESVAALGSGDPGGLRILLPVGVGAALGLLALSRLLAWVFRAFHDVAVGLLTGFVAGSLLIIWPWKRSVVETFEAAGRVEEKVVGYEWFLPDWSGGTLLALVLMALGFAAVWILERTGAVDPGAAAVARDAGR